MDWLDVEFVKSLCQESGASLSNVSDHLKSSYPDQKGLSVANLRRFCATNGIQIGSGPSIPNADLDAAVSTAVDEVGGSYGRRLMTAHLKTKGVHAAEERVGESLRRTHPYYHENRQKGTQKQLNPSSYHAPYFGYNFHMDQNEKLVDFGITFVLAVDGCSNFIPSYSVMPKKNNVTIYREVFKKAVEDYGLWEEVIVDHGKEFYLSLFMQDYLRQSSSCQRPPYRQVASTVNNRIERIWVEVNQRVGYPMKYCMLDLEKNTSLSRENKHDLFAMSQLGMLVASHGLQTFVSSWNLHNIPGKGCPSSYVPNRKNSDTPLLIDDEDAKSLYEAQAGGSLSEESFVGEDRLIEFADQEKRNTMFSQKLESEIGQVGLIFGATANYNYVPLQSAIQLFIDTTYLFCA